MSTEANSDVMGGTLMRRGDANVKGSVNVIRGTLMEMIKLRCVDSLPSRPVFTASPDQTGYI